MEASGKASVSFMVTTGKTSDCNMVTSGKASDCYTLVIKPSMRFSYICKKKFRIKRITYENELKC